MSGRILKKFSCNCGKEVYRNPECTKACPVCGRKMEIKQLRNNHIWKPSEDEYIRKNYKTKLYPDLAELMGFTECQVANRINKLGLRLPNAEFERRKKLKQFFKGQLSWNKGLKLPNIPNSGQFKKGMKPKNTAHDGAIRFRKRTNRNNVDYYFIRIKKGEWIPLHNHLWIQKHGPIPKGMVVRFKDGNHLNCKLDNLELITRGENLKRNYPDVKKDLIYSDRYIAARLKVFGKKNQLEFINKYPELIEAKRQQLFLRRSIVNADRRKIAVNG